MINQLKKNLAATGYRCAQQEDGTLFLTRNTTDPTLTYLSPERFVEDLQKSGQTINPKTLKIGQLKKAAAPKEETPKETPEEPPKEAPKEKAELPAWDVVKDMKYNDLKSFAADHDVDFPGRVKKDKLLDLVKKALY